MRNNVAKSDVEELLRRAVRALATALKESHEQYAPVYNMADNRVAAAELKAEGAQALCDQLRDKNAKLNAALDNHLCPEDKADWLACKGHPSDYCEVCGEDLEGHI